MGTTLTRIGIDAIAVYSARYGYLVRWPLGDALDTLAGAPVDLALERAAVAAAGRHLSLSLVAG